MKQQSSPNGGAVFLAKRPEMARVAQTRASDHLDLDEAVVGLDHEVHFFPDSCCPTKNFRSFQPRIAPREQIVKHEILEMRDAGLVPAG